MRALGELDIRRAALVRRQPQRHPRPGRVDAPSVRDGVAGRGRAHGVPRAEVRRDLGRPRSERRAGRLPGGRGGARSGRVRGDRRPARRRRRLSSTATTRRTWSSTTTSRSRSSVRAAAPAGLRATAAHEFFHAVQFAYDSSEDAWLTEGTAVWMEDRVADDVNANRRWLRSSPLVHPWVPVDSSRADERIRRVDLLAVPDGERRRARPGPDDHPPRVGAGRGRPRRSEPVLGARGPAGAQRARPLAGGRARDVRRVEPGAGGVLRGGLRVSARSGLPAAPA